MPLWCRTLSPPTGQQLVRALAGLSHMRMSHTTKTLPHLVPRLVACLLPQLPSCSIADVAKAARCLGDLRVPTSIRWSFLVVLEEAASAQAMLNATPEDCVLLLQGVTKLELLREPPDNSLVRHISLGFSC